MNEAGLPPHWPEPGAAPHARFDAQSDIDAATAPDPATRAPARCVQLEALADRRGGRTRRAAYGGPRRDELRSGLALGLASLTAIKRKQILVHPKKNRISGKFNRIRPQTFE